MPKALSLVVIGRSLDPEERMQLRNATPSPLSVVAELPTAPQSLDELNRLRPNAALVLVNGEAPPAHHGSPLGTANGGAPDRSSAGRR